MASFVELGNGDPWTYLAKAVWGVGWVLVFIAIINSAVANANAGANATTRTWFAMGRIRLLPEFMAAIHPRWKSPHVAVIVQFVFALALALALGFKYEPYTAFILMATIFTLILISIYIVILIACIAYYWRFQRQQANVIMHGLIPDPRHRGVRAGLPDRRRDPGLQVRLPARLPHLAGGAGGRRLDGDRDRVPDLSGEKASRSPRGDGAHLPRRAGARRGRRARRGAAGEG